MTNCARILGGKTTHHGGRLKRQQRFIFLVALATLLARAGVAQATAYAVIYNFKGSPDGVGPHASVIIDSHGALYGTTYIGGTSGLGTVFKLTKAPGEPWSETVLHSFSGSDGSNPRANVVFGSNGVLYGTTATDSANAGTIFSLAPPSVTGGVWTETVLYAFASSGGNIPDGAVLIGPGGTMFTTTQGNTIPGGTAVALVPPKAPGGTWTASVIYSFPQPADPAGANPFAGLVSEGGALYGTDYYGGDAYCSAYGCGVVYELTPPEAPGGAWTETTIHTFGTSPGDGAGPLAALTVGPGGALYGTTVTGGNEVCASTGYVEGCGTVFQLAPPTTPGGTWTESVIYNFTGTNGDGAAPVSSVVVGQNGVLYGTTQYGGSTTAACPVTFDNLGGCGIVFELTPPTTPGGIWTEKVLHNFTGENGDGSQPYAGLPSARKGCSMARPPEVVREQVPYSPSSRERVAMKTRMPPQSQP